MAKIVYTKSSEIWATKKGRFLCSQALKPPDHKEEPGKAVAQILLK
jgi:hypothetical protein